MSISRQKSIVLKCNHYIIVVTKHNMNPHKLPFSMLNFQLMQNFTLAFQGQWPKTQKLTQWKPALNIRKRNSSHLLQDFCNAFLTKDHAKYLSQSQGQTYLFTSNLNPSSSFCYNRKANFLKLSLGMRLRVWEFVAQKILPFQPFPCNFPDLRLRILGNQERSGKSQNFIEL